MTRLRYFILGCAVATAAGAYAAPSILGAIPLGGCADIANVAASTTSEPAFAAYPGRKSLIITNNDTAIAIYVRRGGTATTASPRVPPGEAYILEPEGGYMWEGTVDVLAASGTPSISGEQCR